MKKNFKSLPEVKAEFIALRKAQGLPPLENGEPKTLDAARKMLASLKGSRPAIRQSVATVAKAFNAQTGDSDALSDIQAALDAATGSNRVRLLNKHAASYLVEAQKARADRDYAKEAELLRARQRIQKREAYELFALPAAERKTIERQSSIPAI
jgi:hypothetical protein